MEKVNELRDKMLKIYNEVLMAELLIKDEEVKK